MGKAVWQNGTNRKVMKLLGLKAVHRNPGDATNGTRTLGL